MNRIYLLCVFQALCLSMSAQAPATSASVPAGYTLVWADEFDKDGQVDETKWGYEQGFMRNHELQWYQKENAKVENGLLVIEARADNRPNPN